MSPRRLLISSILLLALPGALYAFVSSLRAVPLSLFGLGGGFVSGALLEMALYETVPLIAVFEHELTHAIACVICGRRVAEFLVREGHGGHVLHAGPAGTATDFIALAPYVFPTLTVASVLFRPAIAAHHLWWFDIWVGVTLGFHTLSTIREIRLSWHSGIIGTTRSGHAVQTDLGTVGLWFALIWIVTGGLAVHGITLAMFTFGYRGLFTWMNDFWLSAQIFLGTAATVARELTTIVAG